MIFKLLVTVALFAGIQGFTVPTAPLKTTRLSVTSKSLPFLEAPSKLDGTSLVGDYGFDPMGLSDIQADLQYARWAELKHGRICMLAIVGMVTQEYGPFGSGWHLPSPHAGQFSELDPFKAVAAVGFEGNMQIFLAIGVIELVNFNKHYGEGTPGDIGWDFLGLLEGKTDEQIRRTMEQEIVHCRLAMIAFTGAAVQTLIFPGEGLLG
ncbi:hypothetical protein TrST_g9695 [Triparma strigata]|uniref:Uncharacterized protein n=1 Tax=Triparma strigata TaxID=1606541 RepID=A0A9W6ZW30_9STRA|nr:hypothetical protein TrST_g9695 [Triparma strigata]